MLRHGLNLGVETPMERTSDGQPWDPDGWHDVAWKRRRGNEPDEWPDLKARQWELNNRQQTESGPDLKAGQLELNNRQQTESGPVLKVVWVNKNNT